VLLALSVSVPIFLRDFPVIVLNKQLLANCGFTVILALGGAFAPSLQAEIKPGVYLDTLCYVGGDLIDFGT
jgi:hypothetical protein